MGITEFLAEHIMMFFEATGYFSIFILMAMESMIFPVPSEAVMPPAGLLIAQGRFTFAGVVIASTLGSIAGSLASYYMGAYGGKPFVDKFGKYFLLDKKALETGEKYFTKHGDITIFVCRFIPVVRHLISIPAGAGRMNIVKFSVYTIAGAAMWNSLLTWAGVKWGQAGWDLIMEYAHTIDLFIVAAILIFGAYFFWKHYTKIKATKSE